MSFRLKIVLGIILIQALLLVILVSISLNFLRISNEIELSKRASSLVSLFSVALRDAVRNKEYESITAEARVMSGQPGVVYARVLVEGKHFYSGVVDAEGSNFIEDFMIEDVDDGVFDVYASITESNGTVIGRVELGLSIREIANVMDAARRQISMIAIAGMTFSVLMAILLGNYFSRQLKALRDASRNIASGNIGYQMFIKGDDELAQTANAFNTMSRKLALLYSDKQSALNAAEDRAFDLREKEKRIKAILENAGDGIITIDDDGDIESFNATAERMFGYTQNEVIGENITMLMDESYAVQHDEYLSRYLKTKKKRLMLAARELSGRHKDGTIFPMELDVSEMLIEGKRLYIGIARDITERKKTDDELRKAQLNALESARAKFEFIANISHEIRSPMNGVLTMINLLDDSDLTEQQREYVSVIHDSGSAMITIINDILDFSRLEAGKLDLDSIEFDLELMIEDVCRLLHANASGKGIDLVHMIEGNVPTALVGDPARLRQVLVNFVDNAIKFTDKGSVTVQVSVVNEKNDKVFLLFSVIDTGVGLSPRAQRCILEGHKGENKAKAKDEKRIVSGGLGLEISRKLLLLMGGELGIESRQGVGSRFWFRLNFHRQDTSARVIDTAYSQLQGLKVLVLDHRENWGNFLRTQLENVDIAVTVVADVARALEVLRTASDHDQPYNLAIFDMIIPASNGLGLANRIRADVDIIPLRMIIVATAGYRGDSEEVRRAGISGYLSTPISSAQLYECISAVMNLADDAQTLVTRHSLADTRAMQEEHVLLVLSNIKDQQKLLLLVQGQGYRVHFVTDAAAVQAATRRHEYGCIIVDCRGLTPAASKPRLAEVKAPSKRGRAANIIVLIEAADKHLSTDYQAAGAFSTLCWPVQGETLRNILNACHSPDGDSS